MARFDPFQRSFLIDPYPALAQLRAEEPVHFSPACDAWIVTSYADCVQLLHDPAVGSDFFPWPYVGRDEERRGRGQFFDGVLRLTNSEGADHARKRGAVAEAFAYRAIHEARSAIAEVVRDRIAQLARAPRFDAVAALTRPLPERVLASLFGTTGDDYARLLGWARALLTASEPMSSVAQQEHAWLAKAEIDDWLDGVTRPGPVPEPRGVLGLAVAAHARGELNRAELRSLLVDVVLADSLVDFASNALLALAEHPDQYARLRSEPELIPDAVDELARFDPPPQALIRVASSATAIGSQALNPGAMLFLMVGAANRDPAVFTDPDRLDVTRTGVRHLSFALGTHYCPGAPLSKAVMEELLAALVEQVSAFSVVPDGIERRPGSFTTRALDRLTLDVAWS